MAKHGALPHYPADHQVGMVVPQGGSSCAKCEYVVGQNCKNQSFVGWNRSERIPAPTDEYCCDFFEIGEQEMPAKSKAQQQAMAIAEHEPGKLYARNKGMLGMSKGQLHDFAATKRKGLPARAGKKKFRI